MKLYWSSRSPFVRKVMIVAHETGFAGRIEKIPVVVSMTSAPTAEVMRHNPLNKIPTLITDEGWALFESEVICEYLDSLHAGVRLFPVAGAARWQALRWHALGSGMLEAQLLWRSESRRPESRRLQVILDAFEQKVTSALDLLETEAAALAGTGFGIGHVGIGCALAYLDFRFAAEVDWRKARPRLSGWFEDFSRRPAVLATAFVDA